MEKPYGEQLIELWNGNLFDHRKVIYYALDGSERHIPLHFPSFRSTKATGFDADHACRIGGDEFAVFLVGADAKAANSIVETITQLLRINNQFYSVAHVSMSYGVLIVRRVRR